MGLVGKTASNEMFDWDDTEVRPKKKRKVRKRLKRRDNYRSMTPQKWRDVIKYIAENGFKRQDVAHHVDITLTTLEAYLISDVSAMKQIDEARMVWLRKQWDMDELEELFDKMAAGSTAKAAMAELGFDSKKIASFYRLIRRDKTIREMADSVRKLQAENYGDDTVDIADNRENDVYYNAKGEKRVDHGVVQRDRLRVDARWRVMGAYNRKRFGEHKHIDHGGEINVNHAAVLAQARKRLEQSKGATIDNDTGKVDK